MMAGSWKGWSSMRMDDARREDAVARRSATVRRRRLQRVPRVCRFLLLACLLLQIPSPAARALGLVRGPYLQQGTSTSMIVRWRTDTPTESTLRYGQAFDDLSTTISLPGPVTEHEVEVQGLQPFTRYFYSIGTSTETLAGMDSGHYFVTSPPAGTSVATRIWVIGDSGGGNVEGFQVRDEYLGFVGNDLADVWLMLGDNAYLTGTDAEYTAKLFGVYPTILRNTVLWPAPGNHDLTGNPDYCPPSACPQTETGPYYEAFSLPTQAEAGGVPSGTENYYSFDYANIHFVSLNTYKMGDVSVGSDEYDWLVADLAATNQEWIIVYLHFPPYAKGSRDSDSDAYMTTIRTVYNPVFEQRGVDLVMAGHSHSYERSMLIDGHYGLSSTFAPEHVIDGGDGDPLGDGPYQKPFGQAPHTGTVYVVNGVGGNANETAGTLDHPVMVTAFALEGSNVIDVEGNTLDAYFISRYGDILDRFQIVKVAPVPATGPAALIVSVFGLAASAWIVRRRSAVSGA